MGIKLLVFDFDGTLADTKKIVYVCTKNGLNKHKFKLPDNYYDELMGNKQLVNELETWGLANKSAEIAHEINECIFQASSKVKLVDLKQLEKIKKEKIILSNNVDRFVNKVLEKNKIQLFSEVYGAEKIHDKISALKDIIKKRKLKNSEVLYIGDKVKDWRVADAVGCHGIVIANKISWDNKELILSAGPEFIISDVKEIKDIVENLDSS